MRKLVLKCDKCGKEEETIANSNGSFCYDNITIRTINAYIKDDNFKSWVFDLCPACRKSIEGELK